MIIVKLSTRGYIIPVTTDDDRNMQQTKKPTNGHRVSDFAKPYRLRPRLKTALERWDRYTIP